MCVIWVSGVLYLRQSKIKKKPQSITENIVAVVMHAPYLLAIGLYHCCEIKRKKKKNSTKCIYIEYVCMLACMFVFFGLFITMALPMWWIFFLFFFDSIRGWKQYIFQLLRPMFQCFKALIAIAIAWNRIGWLWYSSHTHIYSHSSRPTWPIKRTL